MHSRVGKKKCQQFLQLLTIQCFTLINKAQTCKNKKVIAFITLLSLFLPNQKKTRKNMSSPQQQEEAGPQYSAQEEQMLRDHETIKDQEKYQYMAGRMSFSDLLYAPYTPCGKMYYEFIRPHIPGTDKPKSRIERAKRANQPKLDANSSIVRQFRMCIDNYDLFYTRRQRNIEAFIDKAYQQSKE